MFDILGKIDVDTDIPGTMFGIRLYLSNPRTEAPLTLLS